MNPQEKKILQLAVSFKFLTEQQIKDAVIQQQNLAQRGQQISILQIVGQLLNQQQKEFLQQKLQVQTIELSEDSLLDSSENSSLDRYETTKEFELPKEFGRYEIIRELGKGNMGRVFLVKDAQKTKPIALKVMLAGVMADSMSEDRFLREIDSMKELDHPNIIKIYEAGQQAGVNYFTMEYIEGTPLHETISNKKLGSRRAAEIASQVARAIHYAHTKNIIHRDIKPSNIVLKGKKPIVMDFGLARKIQGGSKLTRTGSILGTPSYMAPEQTTGKNSAIDERTDVYAIGATLYELLTKKVPFPGSDPLSVLMKVVRNPVPSPRSINPLIPQDLENICLKALEKKKENRYQSALEMAESLENFIEGVAVESGSKGVSSSRGVRSWLEQNKIILVMFFSFICLLIFPSLWALERIQDAEKVGRENVELTQKSNKQKSNYEKLKEENNQNRRDIVLLKELVSFVSEENTESVVEIEEQLQNIWSTGENVKAKTEAIMVELVRITKQEKFIFQERYGSLSLPTPTPPLKISLLEIETLLLESFQETSLSEKSLVLEKAFFRCNQAIDKGKEKPNPSLFYSLYLLVHRMGMEYSHDCFFPLKPFTISQRLEEVLDTLDFSEKIQYLRYKEAFHQNTLAFKQPGNEGKEKSEKLQRDSLKTLGRISGKKSIPAQLLEAYLLYRHAEDYKKAKTIYESLIKEETLSPLAHFELGNIAWREEDDKKGLGQKRDYTRAEKYFEQALKGNSNFPAYLFRYGRAKGKQKNFLGSISELNKAKEALEKAEQEKSFQGLYRPEYSLEQIDEEMKKINWLIPRDSNK